MFTAWGILCWFAGFRQFVRNPRPGVQRIAEVRAASRLLHVARQSDGTTLSPV
jgi:hypothetical protein